MIGAVIGDIIGSRFEFKPLKSRDFDLFTWDNDFTDDSVMTIAVAEALLRSWNADRFETLAEMAKNTLLDIGYWYPHCGYGGRFYKWMYEDHPKPYNSCGNGAAMRISAVGDVAHSMEEVKKLAYKVTAITHNHSEGLKGAEAIAVAVYLARMRVNKENIERYIRENYYPGIKSVEEYHNETVGHGQELCQVSVPQAFAALFESEDYESAIRNCVYIGADCDTTGAICGGIAEALWGVPEDIKEMGMRYLDRYLKSICYRWDFYKKLIIENKSFSEVDVDA